MQALGHWAYQFTPSVSLHWPLHGASAGILLEVAPSLSLFGGLDALRNRIEQGLSALQLQAGMGISVTATSAWWMAQCQASPGACITEPSSLSALLPALPVHVLDQAHAHLLTLERCGIRTLHQLLQLPRSGVSRRFGAALLREMDCGFGQHAELRTWLQPPPVFNLRREMPFHTLHLQGLLNVAQPMLEALQWWLQGQHAGTTRLDWVFHHGRQAVRQSAPEQTLRQVRSAEPQQQADAWLQLLQDELTRQPLQLEVCDISLNVHQLDALPEKTQALFPGPQEQQEAWSALLGRLHARLGNAQLAIPHAHPDPRPEYAHALLHTAVPESQRVRPVRGTEHPTAGLSSPLRLPRPLWFLPQPERLPVQHNRPIQKGPLVFLAGPERIEFGWWDSPVTRRDYFIAQDTEQRQLWIFRERNEQGPTQRWYLQGLYA